MAKETNTKDKKVDGHRELVNEITTLLQPVKDKLKDRLNEKKIDRRIKKAAKLLAHGTKQPQKTAAAKKTVQSKLVPVKKKSSPKKISPSKTKK